MCVQNFRWYRWGVNQRVKRTQTLSEDPIGASRIIGQIYCTQANSHTHLDDILVLESMHIFATHCFLTRLIYDDCTAIKDDFGLNFGIRFKIPLTPMVVLAPGSAHS